MSSYFAFSAPPPPKTRGERLGPKFCFCFCEDASINKAEANRGRWKATSIEVLFTKEIVGSSEILNIVPD
jgi:hypothetical protein